MTGRVRVGICPDFREEGWPSMDRVADALLSHLASEHAASVQASPVAPLFKRRATAVSSGRAALNFDRGLNRLWDYPRHVATRRSQFDVFHVVDHSYSQLVHRLPAARTVVTCHDLDTFRSVLDPEQEPRSAMFRAMTTRILNGMQQAARITCDTAAVRDELVNRGLVPAERVITVPIGVDAAFQPAPDPDADAEVSRLAGSAGNAIELLHVGSNVPRKRIDTLLHIVAAAARLLPNVRLLRVGGAFTTDQERLLGELDLLSRVTVLPALNDRWLAAVYRRAALVLLPSAREGFGLPVVEAMTCGTPVLASDLAVLREVGGGVAEYCPVGNVDAWVTRTVDLLHERATTPERWEERRVRGREWAHRFTWTGFAGSMAAIYADLACRG